MSHNGCLLCTCRSSHVKTLVMSSYVSYTVVSRSSNFTATASHIRQLLLLLLMLLLPLLLLPLLLLLVDVLFQRLPWPAPQPRSGCTTQVSLHLDTLAVGNSWGTKRWGLAKVLRSHTLPFPWVWGTPLPVRTASHPYLCRWPGRRRDREPIAG